MTLKNRSKHWIDVSTGRSIGTYRIVNVNGSPYGANGYVWVQPAGGDSETEIAIRSQPFQMRYRAGMGIFIRAGRVVHAGYGVDGRIEIIANDPSDIINQGFPVASINPANEQLSQSTLEQINNLRAFSNTPADESIQVVPTIYRKLDGTYAVAPQSFTVDLLTAYTPADVDDQVVVCVWLDTDTNTYTTTASNELSQDTDLTLNPTTAMTYINQAVVTAPTNCIGVWSYIVKGDDTTITDTNRFHDLRGIIRETTTSQAEVNAIATKTADYTVTDEDATILADGTSASVTITLPTASSVTGHVFTIKAIDVNNTVSIATTSSETIDGSSASITLTLYQSVTVQSDGTSYWIL